MTFVKNNNTWVYRIIPSEAPAEIQEKLRDSSKITLVIKTSEILGLGKTDSTSYTFNYANIKDIIIPNPPKFSDVNPEEITIKKYSSKKVSCSWPQIEVPDDQLLSGYSVELRHCPKDSDTYKTIRNIMAEQREGVWWLTKAKEEYEAPEFSDPTEIKNFEYEDIFEQYKDYFTDPNNYGGGTGVGYTVAIDFPSDWLGQELTFSFSEKTKMNNITVNIHDDGHILFGESENLISGGTVKEAVTSDKYTRFVFSGKVFESYEELANDFWQSYSLSVLRKKPIDPAITFVSEAANSEGYLFGEDSTTVFFNPSDFGINKNDFFKIVIFPFTVIGNYTEDDDPVPKPGSLLASEAVESEEIKFTLGIMRVKTEEGWKEGQVWVKTEDGWKEAISVKTKSSDTWKEST
jgi:hypothetical protein